MNNERPSSFMDRNTILAVILVMIAWVGWQKYLENKYPQASKKAGAPAVPETKGEGAAAGMGDAKNAVTNSPSENSVDPGSPAVELPKIPEQSFVYEDSRIKMTISNRGLGLEQIQLKNFKGVDSPYVVLAKSPRYPLFATQAVGATEMLLFTVERKDDVTFVGKGLTQEGSEIIKTLRIRPDTYGLDIDVQVTPRAGLQGIEHLLVDHIEENKESSFLMPSHHFQDLFALHGTTSSRVMVDLKTPIDEKFEQVKLAAAGTSYFVASLIDDSLILPMLSGTIDQQEKVVVGRLVHKNIADGPFTIKMTGFAGPKELKVMEAVNPLLRETVDFGWFSAIGFGLLGLLKALYSLFPNYGVAIILLTLIVRILVLPFNISSYRSMKKMQQINPILKDIREKHKGDPQKLNTETMRIMKENKVNPLGGCLPMLIQLPIFLSLYRVFGQSVELYHAPFALWIHDLSIKDPYYVLPILMGITMFVQQKLTPTTMDPAQAKVMAALPIIFSFFMLSLPSSLTLYIFVSTLFGVIQQYVFLRDSRVIAQSTVPQVNA